MPLEIIIRSEADALSLLEKMHDNEILFDDISVTFDGWPKLDIHVTGEKYHNTITPTMMKAFIEYQKGIHRAYSHAKYGVYNSNKLTDEDKKILELEVEVTDGSSNYSVDVQKMVEKIIEQGLDKMTGEQILIFLLVMGVSFFSVTALKAYLEDRKHARLAEGTSNEKLESLETMKFMSSEETKRMEIMSMFASTNPAIDNMQRHAYDAATELFKRAGTADSIEVDGVSVSGSEAQFLTRNAKRKSEDIRMDGSYRLLEVNSSLASEFRVKIRNIDTGAIFWSHVQESSLTEPIRNALIDAEWGKLPVKLKINAKDLAGTISKAMIIGVTPLTDQEVEEYKQVVSDIASMTN